MSIASLLTALIPSASAETIDQIGSGDPSVNAMWQMIRNIFPYTNVGNGFPTLILLKVTEFVLSMIGGTAVCVIIYAGIQLTTGGEEKMAEAKKTVQYALMGLALALLADALVMYAVSLTEGAFVGT